MKSRADILARARRIVVKLGSGLLTDDHNRLAADRVADLGGQLVGLRQAGHEVLLVSSGAVAAGMAELDLKKRPSRLAEIQACAAVGQSKLMSIYDRVFGQAGVHVAQVLLTHDDLKDRTRHLNARQTLQELLKRNILPIINENDTVAVDEIKFGDNDRLAALTTALIDAQLLIILSHVPGFLDHDQVVPTIDQITPAIEKLARGTTRVTSVGGMTSKIEAARIVTRAGSPMIIASGEHPAILAELLAGADHGTLFLPRGLQLASRKRWIAFFQRPAGTITVDPGARTALCDSGKSLLAKGVVHVDTGFGPGDLVSVRDQNGVEFARGLAKVDSDHCNATTGVVMHRDDLVIL